MLVLWRWIANSPSHWERPLSAACLVEVEHRGGLASVEVLDTLFNVGAEVADQALNRPRGGVTERADGVALDLLCQLPEHVNLSLLEVTAHHALHHLVDPRGALAARRALAARLVLVEVRQTRNRLDHVGALVHDDDGGGAETGLDVLERVEVHQHRVTDGLGQHGDGGAAGDDAQEVVPAAADAAAVLLDEVLERDGHLLLDDDRVVDVARDGEELGAGVVLAAETSEPGAATAEDGRGHGDGLDVGDRGGAPVEAHVCRERGLQTGLALLALERLDHGSLLTADVRTGTAADVDVEVVAGARGVLADEALGVGLLDGAVEAVGLVPELTTDVDVRGLSAHGEASEESTFDKLVRVVTHDLTVLARAGLGLVGVDDEVLGAAVGHLGHEGPLQARRETGTTAATQAGLSKRRTKKGVIDRSERA